MVLSVFFSLGIKGLHCKWHPIFPDWFPRSQNFSANSIVNDTDKENYISNPYVFAVDDV